MEMILRFNEFGHYNIRQYKSFSIIQQKNLILTPRVLYLMIFNEWFSRTLCNLLEVIAVKNKIL